MLPTFKVLRPFCIYRIVYQGKAPTNPAPIVFPIYISRTGGKMHALVLNSPDMNMFDITAFVRFIKKMRAVKNIDNYSGVTMYKILKVYLTQIVRKCYRTYFVLGVKRFALLSTGLVPDSKFTQLEKELSDANLFVEAKGKLIVKALSFFTKTGLNLKELGTQESREDVADSKTTSPQDVTTPIKPNIYNSTASTTPTTNPNPTDPGDNNNTSDGLDGYN